MMELVFALALALISYSLIGYPLLLWLLNKFVAGSRGYSPAPCSSACSIVISALNEEKSIAQRLQNLFSQDQVANGMQVIVVSDGSTDGTLAAVDALKSRASDAGVELETIEFSDRGGKPRALNAAVAKCKHEYIVFTDARQTFAADAISQLLAYFSDERVGAVSGELFLRRPGASEQLVDMGAYWRFEKLIRKMEANVHSTVGATGAIYAIRRSLYQEIPEHALIDDMVIPMQTCLQGYRVAFAEQAHAFDIPPTDSHKEWVRKVRTLAGNWQLFSLFPEFFSPARNPVFIQFISHKILRLAMPFCLVAIFISNLFLLSTPCYLAFFVLQCLAYLLAAVAHFSPVLQKMRIPGLIYFFAMLNVAIVEGLRRLLGGDKSSLWQAAYKAS